MTHAATAVRFEPLETAACEALLHAQPVGRLAFGFRDRIDIEPIHFVYHDAHIYGRTQPGAKVDVLAHHPWVAFEVDAVDALFDWRSVVVHGRITFPDPNGAPAEQAAYADGVRHFQALVPAAFTADDPTPDRTLVFVIHVHVMTGRRAVPAGPAA
ncbi:MAG: pyridoxamine 5'-phosphate oxidase family protein [Gemmatimonadaceae bacterium]|jgi:nitroimidazol reductase NimA-like FMN-containing flavoprotein (pyridoxamine 5'-phosphate oxidase superfamily)